jgi:hypothetical protein
MLQKLAFGGLLRKSSVFRYVNTVIIVEVPALLMMNKIGDSARDDVRTTIVASTS